MVSTVIGDRVKVLGEEPVVPDLSYKGHEIFVSSVGKGWRAKIYPFGSSTALPESPIMLEHCSKETIVADAKRIIDARCAASSR